MVVTLWNMKLLWVFGLEKERNVKDICLNVNHFLVLFGGDSFVSMPLKDFFITE